MQIACPHTLGVLAFARELAEMTPWNLIKVILAQGSVADFTRALPG